VSVSDKRICISMFEQRERVSSLLKSCGLGRSSYYYHPKTGRRGRQPSVQTFLTDGTVISNESVVIAIRFILAEEFVCFGYDKITDDLRANDFIINPKKTYRLMKEHKLLCGIVIRSSIGKRKFVQYRVQQAERPMEQLCTDIKYVHVHGQKRNALLLTILDVYTRSIVGQVLWWHIRKQHVIWLMHQVLQKHQVKGITVRTDNGSQFIAHALRDYLKDVRVDHEFTHVATPEENCFIEAYHSIIQKELLEPRQFQTVEEAVEVFDRWRIFYNNRRLHGSLGNIPPNKKWQLYEQQTTSEQMMKMRDQPLSTNGERKILQIEESHLVDKEIREQKLDTFEQQKKTNCFENNVQLNGG
jgi:putative transposase